MRRAGLATAVAQTKESCLGTRAVQGCEKEGLLLCMRMSVSQNGHCCLCARSHRVHTHGHARAARRRRGIDEEVFRERTEL